jgi:inorganic pyrophosphatase
MVLGVRRSYLAHPWHGIPIGEEAPRVINVFVEMVPTDTVKYEVDKVTGHLTVDRPQRFSNHCPTLYGFVPQTFCGERVGQLCAERLDRKGIVGDGDPIDICVLTERPIQHGNVLVRATPIGGLRMIDGEEVDDKIVAVLHKDSVYGTMREISECPSGIIERLQHYFLTYKDMPGPTSRRVELAGLYGSAEAREVLRRSREDYESKFPEIA